MDKLNFQRSRLVTKYIFFELLPIFLIGVALFIFIIFMFQSFKLTEYIVVNDASIGTALKLFFYQCLSYLPTLLPIALLFCTLSIYSRLSADSEVAAMLSVGLSPTQLSVPAFVLGLLVTLISFQVSSRLAPWGNRRFDILAHEVAANRPPVTIREGVFSEGFFNLVVYANEVDEKSGQLRRIFIFDERSANTPLTIVAAEGEVVTKSDSSGYQAFLRLKSGNVHRSNTDVYTKIDFDSYDISLHDSNQLSERRLDNSSRTMSELEQVYQKATDDKEARLILLEWHRRLTLPATCFIFAILGVALGFVSNRRSARSGSLVICISIAIANWISYVGFETLAKQGLILPWTAAWATNAILFAISIRLWLRLPKPS
jgi:lipopolysaccharide export system permease protein